METLANHRSDEETIATVLSWSGSQLAKLTYQLLLSLEETDSEEAALARDDIESLWEDEAQRRLADFDAGKIGSRGREEAMRLAREGLAG